MEQNISNSKAFSLINIDRITSISFYAGLAGRVVYYLLFMYFISLFRMPFLTNGRTALVVIVMFVELALTYISISLSHDHRLDHSFYLVTLPVKSFIKGLLPLVLVLASIIYELSCRKIHSTLANR